MHASCQGRFGFNTPFGVSARFSVKDEHAFMLFPTSWIKIPCTELTFASVAPDCHCHVSWLQKVKL
jgi:hypothetical protein